MPHGPVEAPGPVPVQIFDGVAAVSQGDVLLAVWRSAARAARIRWVGERARELIAQSGHGIVAAQFLLPSATPPGLREVSEIRAALPAVLGSSRRLIIVPLGDRAWQSVVRAVMRAGLALLGESERIKIAPSAAAAIDLVAAVRSPATPDVETLQANLAALHAALAAQPGP